MGTRDPETLSGGQQARIALLRTLLAEPEALLDEPFSSLDDARRTNIARLVKSEAQRRNLPVLLVSHDPRDIDAATDKVIELEISG